MPDIEMADPEDSLVSRRSRRSTAGNRMQAALAEIALEDLNKDAEDDNDFVVDKYEEDIFESDFESTDEEVESNSAHGDKEVEYEERKARKAARTRVEKATVAAHARQKVTFNPDISEPQASSFDSKSRPKRRVSLGMVVDAETGKVLHDDKEVKRRESQRKHTILMRSAHVDRMKKSEEKKAAQTPKKAKTGIRSFSQAELISRALDNEDGNLVEHRDYLKLEEEKRRRARVARDAVEGPLLRWISRAEEVAKPPSAPSTAYGYSYGSVPTTNYPQTYTFPIDRPFTSPAGAQVHGNVSSSTLSNPYMLYVQRPTPPGVELLQGMHAQVAEVTEIVEKNYVIHEIAQHDGALKPSWSETMTAMFGDFVNWEELKVYIGKGRPLSRTKTICPVTGAPAKYVDPRSGVPYANLEAFKTLTKVLGHQFVWSKELCCYTRDSEWDGFGHNVKSNDSEGVKGAHDKGHSHRRSARLEP